ncbi:LysM peptidoglycan-binding domain-containing protein, partial [Acinetobacter sp. A11]
PTKSSKNAKEETPETYTVKSGDSLGNIANRYHLQLDYLASLNGLSRNSSVRVGQRLKLTGDVPTVETAKADTKSSTKTVAAGKNTERYTVKSGESLNSIASRAGISVRELAEMNALKANANLQRGQNIVIPKTVVEYKVKRGDTLIGLASKYGLETNFLAELNNLTPSTQLRIGDVIKVPNL